MASTDDILSLFHQCFDYSSTVYADYAKRTDSVLSSKETDISSGEHITIFKKLYGDDIMDTVTIEFELDTELYEKAKAILATFGLTVEEACVLFLKAVVARRGLPFPLTEQELDLIRNKRMKGGESE